MSVYERSRAAHLTKWNQVVHYSLFYSTLSPDSLTSWCRPVLLFQLLRTSQCLKPGSGDGHYPKVVWIVVEVITLDFRPYVYRPLFKPNLTAADWLAA